MLNRHRSTSLKYFTRNCPAALAFYNAGEPMDRDLFACGIAAHAVLQDLGEHTAYKGAELSERQMRDRADAMTRELITRGRGFDGTHEPPLPPDAVIEGRDLALAWALETPFSPGGQHEKGLAIDAAGNACAYDDPRARYVAILDVLEETEVGTEEYAGRAIVVTEWKSAWPTDESELDTVQTRGHAVLVDAHYCNLPEPPDLIIRRVVNLRTRQTFEHTLSPTEDRALLDQWKRDLLMLCDAADKTTEARPGAGCAGCSWAHRCDHAWQAVKDPSDVVTAFAAVDAVRSDLFGLAKLACKESVQPVAGGTVGYQALPGRTVPPDAYRTLAAEWCNVLPESEDAWAAEHATFLGLLAALGIGVTQVENAAKALYPGRDGKESREELIAKCTQPAVRRTFGVQRDAAVATETADAA